MATINLSGQELEKQDIRPKLLKLKQLMDQRKVVWSRIDDDKKKKWVRSDKDPVMSLAWDIYKYLKNNFFKEVDDVT